MAYFDKTEYAKYVSLQNVSASGDPADAPEGGVYLYASGTAADPNEAHLWLRNAGGAPIDLAEGGTLQMAGDSGIDSVDMANDTLTFAGGDGLTSAVSDNQVSFSLNANSTSFQIASDEIQLASAVAGDGLSLSSHALAVNVDDTGIEIDSDSLRLKDSGVVTAKIADDAVTGAKIAADAVDSEHIALGALDSEHYASGSIENGHLAGSIANAKLSNSSVTVTAGDGLKDGGEVALGASVTLNIEPADFAGDGLADDGSDNLALDFGGMATEMTGDVADTDEFAISDGGTMKKVDFSVVRDAVFADVSGDATVAAGGALTIAADAVDSEHIALGALDSEHYATGSIESNHLKGSVANDKLANSSVTVTAGDGLKDGGEVALGASVTLNIEPADFAGNGLEDDGSDNLRIAIDGIAASFAAATVQDADMFAVHDADADVLKSVTMQYLRDSMFGAVSGDATVAAGGALTIANGAVETDMLADSAVTSAKIADYTIVSADMATGTLINRNYGSGSIEGGHIGSDEIDSQHYAAGSIDNEHIADATIANAKLINDSVTLTAGAGMAALGEVELGASLTVAVDGVLEDLDTLGAPSTDGEFIVATGAGAFAYESGNTARTSLGLGTGDSPEFAGLTLGEAEDQILFPAADGSIESSADLKFVAGQGLKVGANISGSANVLVGGALVLGQYANGAGIANESGQGVMSITGQDAYFAADLNVTVDLGVSGDSVLVGDLTVGQDGAVDIARFHGDTSGTKMEYSADMLKFSTSGQADHIKIGGDASSDFAVDVANVAGNGGKVRAAAFVTYSDESLKSDVEVMNTALDAVMALNGVEFTWKDSGERDFGFIAQEVAQVLPKAVHTAANGISGVDYSRLTSVLVEAVKAQQVQIEELKAILKK